MLRNPFCILEGTEKECSYLGSVKTMKVARVEEVETLPERSDDGAPVSQAPIAFFPTSFVEYQFSDDSVRFSETGKLTSSGLIYNQKVEGFHPGTDSEALYEVARLADGHYIVIVELFAGPIRLLGTKETPFIFNSNFDSGKKRTDTAGSLFEFTGQSDFPSITLTSSSVTESSPCALLTQVSWLFKAWEINVGANYRLDKIYVDPNPAGLITSVNTRPDGTLYNHNGAAIDTLVWNAGGWYEPQNGPHTIIGTWQAEFYGIQVTTGSPATSCSYFFIQAYSILNSPPEFTAIAWFGTAEVGNTLTILTGYNDVDGDAYDPASSVFQFWQADDALGTNETLIHTGGSYTLLSGQGGKYVQARAVPHALTGASPGAEVRTDWVLVPTVEVAPVASSVAISGIAEVGELLSGSYVYSDANFDLEGATVEEWYSYTDAAGTLGETLLGTGPTYSPVVGDVNKYLRYKVTPVALTGASPGTTVSSAVFGPILQFETFTFQTNSNPGVDGAFSPSITYAGGDTPKWIFEDASELTGTSISTTGNGLDGTTQDVVLKVVDLSLVTAINFEADKLVGTLNVSTLDGLVDLRIRNNALTTLSGLVSTQDFTTFLISNNSISNAIDFSQPDWSNCNFQAENCTFTIGSTFKAGSSFTQMLFTGNTGITAADLSNCIFAGGTGDRLNFSNCTSLATLTLAASGGGVIGRIFVTGTAITSLDTSGVQISDQLQARTCTSLTTVTLGAQTYTLTQILIDNCSSASGALDLSGFTSLPGYILCKSSPFDEIILPSGASNAMIYGIVAQYCAINTVTNLSTCTAISNNTNFMMDLRNNGMTTGQVNTALDDLLTVSSSGFGSSRAMKIEGNTAPDAGPPDGDQAAIDLAALGFVVTTD